MIYFNLNVRCPNSKRAGDRRYYRASSCYRKKGISYAQRNLEIFLIMIFLIWNYSKVKVICRCICLKDLKKKNRAKITQNIWRSSDKRYKWHVKHGIEFAQKEAIKPKIMCVCIQCGKEFYTSNNRKNISKCC